MHSCRRSHRDGCGAGISLLFLLRCGFASGGFPGNSIPAINRLSLSGGRRALLLDARVIHLLHLQLLAPVAVVATLPCCGLVSECRSLVWNLVVVGGITTVGTISRPVLLLCAHSVLAFWIGLGGCINSSRTSSGRLSLGDCDNRGSALRSVWHFRRSCARLVRFTACTTLGLGIQLSRCSSGTCGFKPRSIRSLSCSHEGLAARGGFLYRF
mmetsp:Transcript_4528/g.8464  ORF Transcript_4528/g.8464 Transcript_4528/m.8464 type:complete len:212 (+) Transcript_4528:2771-3406(+)